MITTGLKDIINALDVKVFNGNEQLTIDSVSIDSRRITKGCLFFAIKGEKFDGHDFVMEAVKKGASAVVVQKDVDVSCPVLKVADTVKALGKLAGWYRDKFNIPFIAVTGSTGKTTTKNIIASVLEKRYKVLKNTGNFNNHIGLPLTLLKLDNTYDIAVVEMGMSGFGEIEWLSEITKPDAAIITNIGVSHIGKLGSRQNILKAKMEVIKHMKQKGTLILNSDDSFLQGLRGLTGYDTIFYGTEEGADIQGFDMYLMGSKGVRFKFKYSRGIFDAKINIPGGHNVYNALAAISTGFLFNIPTKDIIDALNNLTGEKMRMDIFKKNGITVINDTYNACPESVKAAIDVLCEEKKEGRTVAVLGDMLELGNHTRDLHEDTGRYAAKKKVDLIITIGDNGKYISDAAKEESGGMIETVSFSKKNEAEMFIRKNIRKGDSILFKASRGMRFEEIIKNIFT